MATSQQKIKQLIGKNGLTQSELAKRCGIKQGNLSKMLSGDSIMLRKTLAKIAEALDVSLADIMADGATSMDEFAEAKAPTLGKHVSGYVNFSEQIFHFTSFKQLKDWIQKNEPKIIETPKKAKAITRKEQKNAAKVTPADIDIDGIDLFKEETIDASKVETWSFRKSEDEREYIAIDLGNMGIGYPFDCCGETFTNSEALYICGLFSTNTDKHKSIQRELLVAKSGYDAKKKLRQRYEEEYGRLDWNTFNVEYMKWCVWQKVKGNKDFQKILLSIPKDSHIIENSTKQKGTTSSFWGMKNQELEESRSAIEEFIKLDNPTLKKSERDNLLMVERNKINHLGTWKGVNCMGKILKIAQLCLLEQREMPIDYDLLRSKEIYLFGKLQTFENEKNTFKIDSIKIEEEPQPKTKKVILFDMDGTLVDSSISQGLDWKEFQKRIPQHTLYNNIIDVLLELQEYGKEVWVVSGNVESTIKKTIKHFDLPIPFEHISGYKQGMSMDNLKRKIKVIENALKRIEADKSEILYIGDETDDIEACKQLGIDIALAIWGNDKENIKKADKANFILKEPTEILTFLT